MNILVVGAHGTAGHGIVKCFKEHPGASVTTVSRRAQGLPGCHHVALDLLDEEAVLQAAARLGQAEVVIFAARAPGADAQDEARVNLAMLRNLIRAIDTHGHNLKRVCLIHGTKWYGCHLGAYPIPAREDDPRGAGPLFYFDQYDCLTESRRGRSWDMVTLRPHTVWGFSEGTKNNLVTLVAAYAVLLRQRGLPLHFPGPVETYRKRSQATAADLLGRAAVWACTSTHASDRDFNITNGDTFTWQGLWPRIADHFGMQTGEPGRNTFASALAGSADEWRTLQREHRLQHAELAEIASPGYGDGLFACCWDDVSSTEASREAGWTASADSEEAFLGILRELQRAGVVPP